MKILVGIAIGVLWERQIQRDRGRSIVDILRSILDQTPPPHLKSVK